MIGRPPRPPGPPGPPGPAPPGAPPLGVLAAAVRGSRCQLTVGFFTHRPCDQPGAAVCPGCGRPACEPHLRRDLGQCVECAARQHEGGLLDDLADDMSFYLYRQGYYQRVYGTSYSGPRLFDETSDRTALDASNLGPAGAVDADADADVEAEDAPGSALDS